MDAHASTNAVHGSLSETSLNRLLKLCRHRLLTGRIEIHTPRGSGEIELRAGVVDRARLRDHRDIAAMSRLRRAKQGSYVILQRLPDMDGDLGSAGEFHGDIDSMSLIQVMRYCEDHALTCTITVVNDFDRAEIEYDVGDISRVSYNGVDDDEHIVDILRFDDARFRVSARPLNLQEGAPMLRRRPTEPFTIAHTRDERSMTVDARADERVELGVPVCLQFGVDASWVETDASLVDLSHDGMLVACDRLPKTSQRVFLVIEHKQLGECIALGSPVRHSDSGFGVHFEHANDLMHELIKFLAHPKFEPRARLMGAAATLHINIIG